MIITNREDLERLARSVHDCGRMPDSGSTHTSSTDRITD
jgi:hypothetical protein